MTETQNKIATKKQTSCKQKDRPFEFITYQLIEARLESFDTLLLASLAAVEIARRIQQRLDCHEFISGRGVWLLAEPLELAEYRRCDDDGGGDVGPAGTVDHELHFLLCDGERAGLGELGGRCRLLNGAHVLILLIVTRSLPLQRQA